MRVVRIGMGIGGFWKDTVPIPNFKISPKTCMVGGCGEQSRSEWHTDRIKFQSTPFSIIPQ